MKSSRVTRFNYIVGNKPADTPEGVLEQIKNLCTFLIEEVLETKNAANEADWKEVVDGIPDIRYVASYLQDLAESVGCNVDRAFEKVCDNNDCKFTTSEVLANKWKDERIEDGVECYVDTVVYEGETYYTVRRKEDGKVIKHRDFESVDLTDCIPADLLENK